MTDENEIKSNILNQMAAQIKADLTIGMEDHNAKAYSEQEIEQYLEAHNESI